MSWSYVENNGRLIPGEIVTRFLSQLLLAILMGVAPQTFAQYRTIDFETPDELGMGIKDSMLRATLPPVPKYPQKGKKAQVRAAVWLKITVGELGVVKDVRVVRCVTPGYGFEEAAIQAAKDARFEPGWDGLYPREYVGYYPVVYANPNVTAIAATDEVGRRILKRGTEVIGPGIDAPIVEPEMPPVLAYPADAIRNLVEAVVLTKLRIDKVGRAIEVDVQNVSVPGYKFRERAVEAIKSTQFPIKLKKKGDPTDYDAYYRVYFQLTPEALELAGFALPDDSAQGLVRPIPLSECGRRYLKETIDRHLKGTVVVQAFIDTTGEARVIRVDSSSGYSQLDTNATWEVSEMKFEPARLEGVKVHAWLTLPITYDFGLSDSTRTVVIAETTFTSEQPPDFPTDKLTTSQAYFNLEPPENLPRFTHFEKAVYPLEDWSNNTEGSVKLAAVVDEHGKVLESMLAYSSGNKRFEDAALATIPHHRISPAITNGKPVKAWMSWFVRFNRTSKEVDVPREKRIIKPKPIYIEKPAYPEEAVDQKVRGSVWVRLYVDTTGNVLEVILLESSGHPALDSAALAVAPKYRFSPAIYDGHLARFWLKYEVEFSFRRSDGQ
jgi:TonB family protein